mgnify:CR=1 FL=1
MQVITTHRNTDFDALASVIAGTILYPEAAAVIPKAINPNVKAFLSIHKDLFEYYRPKDMDLSEVSRMVVVDTNQWGRLEGFKTLKNRDDIEIFIWDHHENDCDMNPSWQLQQPMGANITLMIRAMKEKGIALTPIQATLFLCGLYEDTGSLMFPSTTVEDAYAAAYLLEQKADLSILKTFLQPVYGEKQKDILFEMLKSARRKKINNYTVSINITEISGHINNLSLVVHMYREIVNVDAAFGIFDHKESDKCIVIGRSSVGDLNIGTIMRSMGGGGHPGAGSAMLRSVNPSALRDWIVELLEGNQESSIQVRDLMSYPVHSVASDTPMHEVEEQLKQYGCTGLPVMENGDLLGVISRRDFNKVKNKAKLKSPAKAFMSGKPITIAPDKSLMHAARLMVKHDVGRLPVLEDGQIIGIISRSDAMRFFYDAMPE